MNKISIYSFGLVCCSVCVPKEMKQDEIERQVNSQNPTGISTNWRISNDKFFKSGSVNPHICEKDSNRMHYLLNC